MNEQSVNDLMYKWIYGGQLSGWMIICELKMTVKRFLDKSYELMDEWKNKKNQ